MIVHASPPEHYRWLKDRTHCSISDVFKAIECQEDGLQICEYCGRIHGRIMGMIGYDGWTLNAVQMHICLEDPNCFFRLVRPAFSYPFEEVRLGMVLGITPSDNRHSLEFNKRMGFRETYRIKDGWSPGVDMVVQEMLKDECRWLKRRRKVIHG